jgi:tetratricopeptide (TPR) repeat protein
LALLQAVAKVAHTELASVVGEVLPAPPATLASAEFRLLAGDDVGCAAIVDGINASALGSSHERLRYANLLLGLGHDARAADILSAQQRWDSRDLADLAWMYYDLGQGQYAYPIFGSDLVAAGDANSMQAWAILAASGGDVGPVQEWLGEINVAQQLWLRNDTLFELAMVGLQHDSDELLQRVADNVATHTASAASSSEQARLLLLAGRFHEAAALSAMGMRQYRPVRQTLKLSLLTLWQLAADEGRTSATLEAGLVALAEATAAVADSTNDIQEMTVLAHDLLAIGAQRVAFPVLSQLFSVAPQDWYELFRESAVASGRTAYFLQQLGQRLATIEPEDARYDAYLHDLARLGGHAEALPYLSIIVARSDLQTERRRAALYAARDVANALSQQAWFAEQLGTWLETHGLDDPLADIWLYELSEAGEYERAIPHLRRLLTAVRGDHARSATVFYELQTALLATGEGATLVNVIAEELRSPAITTRQQQTYVEILFASSAKQAALPVLEAHANRDPQQWGQAFLHWLAERGDERTGLSFMRRHAADTALSDSLRRDFGERLLAAGLKREALAVFTELARNERPGSAAIEQLLWLWGPRPGHAAIDWLAMRAEFAEGRARAAWADILTRLGASRRAVASLANAAEASDADPVLLQSYVAALLASGDKVAAKTYLSSLVARVPSNAMLRWIAQLAGEHEFTILGHAAWRATLDAQPRDVRALKALGMHAFDRGQRSDMNVDADDYEVQFFYAELLAERGAGDRAVAHYRRARLLLDQLEVIDFRQRVIDAQVLHRLGHLPASVAAYEALLRERPQAQHLRADYVSMLLDSSALQRAKQVLAAQRPAP